MGAIEVTPWPAKDDSNSYQVGGSNIADAWFLVAIAAIVLTFLGAMVLAIVTPHDPNPHAGQVCIHDTQDYVPVISTDMWGHTSTHWQYRTRCLEWATVQHTSHVTPGTPLPSETQQTLTRTQPQDSQGIQTTTHTVSAGTITGQPTLPTLQPGRGYRRT